MMQELSLPVSATSVLRHYADFLDGFVVDALDAELRADMGSSGVAIKVAQTVMQTLPDRVLLAQTCVEFIASLK
jgi:LPPG:FO 2-phospho-L-lactate transferase